MISVGPVTNFRYLIEGGDPSTVGQWVSNVPNYDYIEQKAWWVGKLCDLLNLKSNVCEQDFRNVFEGKNRKGKALLAKSGQPHRLGVDVNFSAPKSVSVVWAIANKALRERISWKNRQAVLETLCFLEDKAAQTRCGEGGKVAENTLG
jgi:conjugative relaxase-like TrwC/TraI family protein